ncbi:MAG: nicotinate (nicotinamide) nucleotide adenylyltransferase [Erysipelotrichaceae bacterium]|nr:nicotinate (nicotinamide) nucleotide adenylyltransferase [Erysipelotrichaceae bacterium]
MERVGIYVGSFNPVHNGHIAIARACIKEGFVDKVRIIATGDYWDKKNMYPLKERIAMLKLAAKKGIVIDETYNEYPYTYQIFRQLTKDYPDKQFHLILGADNLPKFDQWQNYKELLDYGFIILPRDEIGKEEIDRIMKDLHKDNYQILKRRMIHISSTYIREHLDDYEAIKDMIDKKVYQYLIKMERS